MSSKYILMSLTERIFIVPIKHESAFKLSILEYNERWLIDLKLYDKTNCFRISAIDHKF